MSYCYGEDEKCWVCGVGQPVTNDGACSECVSKHPTNTERNGPNRASTGNSELLALRTLLEIAACPNCDGSGAYYDGRGEVCQCQWCSERHDLLNPPPLVNKEEE